MLFSQRILKTRSRWETSLTWEHFLAINKPKRRHYHASRFNKSRNYIFQLTLSILREHTFKKGTAVIWLKYCRYDGKHYPINQSINQRKGKEQRDPGVIDGSKKGQGLQLRSVSLLDFTLQWLARRMTSFSTLTSLDGR